MLNTSEKASDWSRQLLQFEPLFQNTRHRSLAQSALGLSKRYGELAGHQKQVADAFLSATFELHCAPPSAVVAENILSLKYLYIFFVMDDAESDAVEEFLTWIEGREPRPGSTLPSAAACYEELIAEFRGLGRQCDGFQNALRKMCIAMKAEKLAAGQVILAEAEFCELRKHSGAVPSYTECWRTIRGLEFSPELGELLWRSHILDIASEIVYLVNDIGSLERDEKMERINPNGRDPNYVLLRMRAIGDRRAAILEAIQLHNQRIADFHEAEKLLLKSQYGSSPELLGYLEILRSTVNGNLAATLHLVPLRYEGGIERLADLLRL